MTKMYHSGGFSSQAIAKLIKTKEVHCDYLPDHGSFQAIVLVAGEIILSSGWVFSRPEAAVNYAESVVDKIKRRVAL